MRDTTSAAVLEDLAAGRLTVSEAAEQLLRQVETGESSIEAISCMLRMPAADLPRNDATADELLAVLMGQTHRRAVPEAMVASEDQPTLLRAEMENQTLADATLARNERAADAGPRATESHYTATSSSADSATPEPVPGALIKARYELEALVGRGGMGVVFSALDRLKVEARDPHPEVAVKILNAQFQRHPNAFVALQREASKAHELAHPNVATVFNFDRDGQMFFITMELLRGQSLEAVIRATRGRGIGRKAALPLLRGIAEGLAYAHRKGIVHSDLKPANVFLVEDGTPKILDFGIARAVPSAGRSGPQDQFDAGSLGAYTVAYATQDMIQGGTPAPADDLYALGVIAYELLTGRHPFAGQSAADASRNGLTPTPIRELRHGEWRTLARCLAFDRSARPPDAGAFQRLFFGSTRLRNALIVATGLAVASSYLLYRNYEQSGPSTPWDQLSAADQKQIEMDLTEGKRAWDYFYIQQHQGNALDDALNYYSDAYARQKGNRDAVRGLKRVANEALKRVESNPSELHETARSLASSSDFLAAYPPVMEAIGH
jgi:serine/threonine protein kinase